MRSTSGVDHCPVGRRSSSAQVGQRAVGRCDRAQGSALCPGATGSTNGLPTNSQPSSRRPAAWLASMSGGPARCCASPTAPTRRSSAGFAAMSPGYRRFRSRRPAAPSATVASISGALERATPAHRPLPHHHALAWLPRRRGNRARSSSASATRADASETSGAQNRQSRERGPRSKPGPARQVLD